MKESASVFGTTTPAVGILTMATAPTGRGNLPAVVLLNAGRMHRVGPNRLYVRLARQLASAGFTVLRFDFAGIGDSPRRGDDVPLDEAVLEETREAMEYVTRTTGADRFVLIGLCEGARNAFRVATADARVVGVLMIDGFAYRTAGFYWRRGVELLARNACKLGTALKGGAWRRRPSVAAADGGGPLGPDPGDVGEDGPYPTRDSLLPDMCALLDRGTRLFFLYTSGGMDGVYNYGTQLYDAFPLLRAQGGVMTKYMSRTDHTFTLLAHQDEMLSAVRQWMTSGFGPPHSGDHGTRG